MMFSNSVKIFSFAGFDIKLDPSWLLIAALITWSLAQQYFPSTMPGLSQQTYLLMGVFAMLCFFASLLLHEMSHSVVARHFGIEIKGITLFLFGGVAELEAEPKSAEVELLVAIAGPLMSLLLSLGFWILAGVSTLAIGSSPLTEVLSYLSMINLVLALFNLVPAFPLDGGRVLRAWLWHRHGDILRATETAAKSGTIFAMVLMFFGVLALFQGIIAAGIWQIMIGLFILAAARSSYQHQLAQSVFANKSVRELMVADPVVVSPGMTLSAFVNTVMLQKHVQFVPVVEDGALLGHMDAGVLASIDRENWANTQVGDVFAGLENASMVSPDMAAQDLMSHISKTGRRKFLVVDDHKLLGVITLADLTDYLRMADILRHPQTNG
ncbi:site-2 protease family protein [Sulfitobacter sediminilitoris]